MILSRNFLKDYVDLDDSVSTEELAEAIFFVDDATKNLGKWHSKYKNKDNPMHLELRLWQRRLYCQTGK